MLLPRTCFEIHKSLISLQTAFFNILCSPCGSNVQQRLFVERSVLSLSRLIAASHWCNHTTLLYLHTPWWSQSYLYFQTLHRTKEKKKHHSRFKGLKTDALKSEEDSGWLNTPYIITAPWRDVLPTPLQKASSKVKFFQRNMTTF